jgi:hypothetical protein
MLVQPIMRGVCLFGSVLLYAGACSGGLSPGVQGQDTKILSSAFFESETFSEIDTEKLYLLKNEEGTTKGLQDSTELYREKEDLAEILVGVLQEDLAQGNLGKKIKKLYAEEYLDDSEGFASDNNPMVGKPTNSVLQGGSLPSSLPKQPAVELDGYAQLFSEQVYKMNSRQAVQYDAESRRKSNSFIPESAFNTKKPKGFDALGTTKHNMVMIKKDYPDALYVSPSPGVVLLLMPLQGISSNRAVIVLNKLVDRLGGKVLSDKVVRDSEIYILNGYVSASSGTEYTSLIADWHIFDNKGIEVHTFFVQKIIKGLVIDDPWQAVEPPLLEQLAELTFLQMRRETSFVVTSHRRSIAASRGSVDQMPQPVQRDLEQRKVLIRRFSGAPSDGNRLLHREISRVLDNTLEFEVVFASQDATYFLDAYVEKETKGAVDHIKIVWAVSNNKESLGEIVQENDIPTGSLDNSWGGQASLVVQGAAKGIGVLLSEKAVE